MPGTSNYKVIGLLTALMIAAVIACGGSRTDQSDSYNDPQSGLVVLSEQQGLVVFSLARDLGVGPNRIAVTVQRFDRTQVPDRASDLTVTYGPLNVDGDVRAVDAVTWRSWPFSGGAYTFMAEFDAAGTWQIAVTLDEEGEEVSGTAAIQVRQELLAPGVGSPAPRVPTKTASSVEEVREISSDPDPRPEFYRVSLDEVIGSGTPVAVTFSTPAFCQTNACGPQLDVLSELQAEYSDRSHFVHVEIWDNPRVMLEEGELGLGVLSPVVGDWGLPTEPWTFLINGDGQVFARFEAFATRDELAGAMEAMLAGGTWRPG